MLSRQEMFNRAWVGLALQGFEQSSFRHSYRDDPVTGEPVLGKAVCSYEGEGGRRCAVGWVDPTLTNKNYPNGMTAWYEREGNLRELVAPKDVRFLQELQDAHDRSTSPLEMRSNFVELAKRKGLTLPDVESQPATSDA